MYILTVPIRRDHRTVLNFVPPVSKVMKSYVSSGDTDIGIPTPRIGLCLGAELCTSAGVTFPLIIILTRDGADTIIQSSL